MTRLETRYRRWLLVYPRVYRAQRGDEIVGLLLDTARVGQQRPAVRDVVDVIRHGLAMRLAAGPALTRPETIASAAPLASAVAAGLAVVALIFGELPLYGPDPGYRPNEFMYGAFASVGVYLYPLVILAGVARLAGLARASRRLSVAALTVAVGILMWSTLSVAFQGSGRPPLPLLLTIAACCVPAALHESAADTRTQRALAAATIIGLAIAGAFSFSGRPHGHPHWDPRSAFYLMPDGIVGSWRPYAPLAAAAILIVSAWLAARRNRVELWHAAAWALVPAALATYGPRQWDAPWVTRTYHLPLILVLVLAATVVAANRLLRRANKLARGATTVGRGEVADTQRLPRLCRAVPEPLFVETRIRADRHVVWERTQNPALHQRWDLRFTSIAYLPATDGQPQGFSYAVRIPWRSVSGVGVTVGERSRPDGQSTSALRFASTDRLSPIENGHGWWRYVPDADGCRFLTGYDYDVRWGKAGRVVDRCLLRPAMGWATAWSFDRLRIWCERDTSPERSRNAAVADALIRAAAAIVASRSRNRVVLVAATAALCMPTHATVPRAARCLRKPPDALGRRAPRITSTLESP